MASASRIAALALLGALAAGCASGGQPEPMPSPAPGSQPGSGAARTAAPWRVEARYQLDAWLHAFAMVQNDSTEVPYFRRGYRDRMVALRNRSNTLTQLDANREQLRARLATNRNLTSAQFLPLYFSSWEELYQAVDLFLQADGDPRRSNDPTGQAVIATFAGVFPTAQDRDWLRLFAISARDEADKFYRGYWTAQQRERRPVIDQVDSLWNSVYLPRMRRYLNNTQLTGGTMVLSLPLDGEGRTIADAKRTNTVAVTFPDTPAEALDAIYVFAHEVSGSFATRVVTDNITPTQQRSGLGDLYASAATVHGGALLLKRVAPELLDGYVRYYLHAAQQPEPRGDMMAALARAFPLPDTIIQALGRQLDSILGGI